MCFELFKIVLKIIVNSQGVQKQIMTGFDLKAVIHADVLAPAYHGEGLGMRLSCSFRVYSGSQW